MLSCASKHFHFQEHYSDESFGIQSPEQGTYAGHYKYRREINFAMSSELLFKWSLCKNRPKKKKKHHFSKTWETAKLPAIVDLPIYTSINWSVKYLMISLKILWFLFWRNLIEIFAYKKCNIHSVIRIKPCSRIIHCFSQFCMQENRIWNKNQHMDE